MHAALEAWINDEAFETYWKCQSSFSKGPPCHVKKSYEVLFFFFFVTTVCLLISNLFVPESSFRYSLFWSPILSCQGFLIGVLKRVPVSSDVFQSLLCGCLGMVPPAFKTKNPFFHLEEAMRKTVAFVTKLVPDTQCLICSLQ
jgi:hypothetical protein